MSILFKKFKGRLWALRQNGFSQSNLVRVYTAMIRPVSEFCSLVFHSMLTEAHSLELDRLQMQALKVIFDWKNSYGRLLELSGLERLSQVF